VPTVTTAALFGADARVTACRRRSTDRR
jgi:hypothetical protein